MIFPAGLIVDESGKIYVADTGNHRVQVFRKGQDSEKIMKAVIVAGGGLSYKSQKGEYSNSIWDATEMSTNLAYRALIYQGFTSDTIYYLNPNTKLDLDGDGETDVDAPSGDVSPGDVPRVTTADLRQALTEWAIPKNNPSTGIEENVEALVLYLVDHGKDGLFQINDRDALNVSELSGWLDEVQKKISKIIVIYDACYSGSFLYPLKGDNRIIITSSTSDQLAWFVANGSVSFSSYFWSHIFNGQDVEKAFLFAREATGYKDGENQYPLMDDNNDGTYCYCDEDVCIPNQGYIPDGDLARNTYIGSHTPIIGDAPFFKVSVSLSEISDGTKTAVLSADEISDEDGIDRVWAVIRPPDYILPPSGNPVVNLPVVELVSDGNGRYKGEYDKFNVSGTYLIAVYARDTLGNTSSPKLAEVTVNKALKRKAIILVGKPLSNGIESLLGDFGNLAYTALGKNQGYSDDDIYFMSPIASGGVDGSPNLKSLEDTLDIWKDQTQDLVLYMVGESDIKDSMRVFRINEEETLSAGVLNAWLNDFQAHIPGKITVVYDSCDSATFLSSLAPPEGKEKERILIGSTDKDQPAHFVIDGKISFSKYFWDNVSVGKNVSNTFLAASASIKCLCENQNPQMDTDGDGVRNDLWDIEVAGNYFIGSGIMEADSNITALLTDVSPHQTLSDGKPEIWAKYPSKPEGYDIRAVIHPPKEIVDGSICYVTALKNEISLSHYNDAEKRYEPPPSYAYKEFSEAGEYIVSIYVKDDYQEIVSKPVTTKVCWKDNCWNKPPDADNDGVPDTDDIFLQTISSLMIRMSNMILTMTE